MVATPFVVLVDTAEQLPYTFTGLKTDAKPIVQPLSAHTKPCNLTWGDYSIDGYASAVAVERKSYADLASTLTRGRKRFLRELEALQRYDAAWVVCEVELSDLLRGPPGFSRVNPKTLWRSVMYFQLRYPKVHWWGCPGREAAERVTFRLLEAWWNERVANPSKESARRSRFGGAVKFQ